MAPSSRLCGKAKMLTFISFSLAGNLSLYVTSEIFTQPGNTDSLLSLVGELMGVHAVEHG